MHRTLYHRYPSQSGFTLVELVIVIILVAILGATAAPRLLNSGYDAYGLRDQLIGRLQLVQTQAMNSISDSYRLAIYDDDYQIESCAQSDDCDLEANWSCSPAIDATGSCQSREALDSISLTTGSVRFDSWGRPLTCPDGLVDSRCLIAIGSDRSITIESEGYLYGE